MYRKLWNGTLLEVAYRQLYLFEVAYEQLYPFTALVITLLLFLAGWNWWCLHLDWFFINFWFQCLDEEFPVRLTDYWTFTRSHHLKCIIFKWFRSAKNLETLFFIYTGESYLNSLLESLHITEILRIERMSGLISRPHSRNRAVNKCGDTLCFYCVKMEAGGQWSSYRWIGLNQILVHTVLQWMPSPSPTWRDCPVRVPDRCYGTERSGAVGILKRSK